MFITIVDQQAKEIEQLKEEKEALRLGYNEVMGETLLENTKLKEDNSELDHKLKRVVETAKLNVIDWNKCEEENAKLREQLNN